MIFDTHYIPHLPVLTTESFLVCDIDGTLYDDRARLPLIDHAGGPDYRRYHAHFAADRVCVNLAGSLRDVVRTNPKKVRFLTIRPARYHADTRQKIAQDLDLAASDVQLLKAPPEATIKNPAAFKASSLLSLQTITPAIRHLVFLDNTLQIHAAVHEELARHWPELQLESYLVDIKYAPPRAIYYKLKPK